MFGDFRQIFDHITLTVVLEMSGLIRTISFITQSNLVFWGNISKIISSKYFLIKFVRFQIKYKSKNSRSNLSAL